MPALLTSTSSRPAVSSVDADQALPIGGLGEVAPARRRRRVSVAASASSRSARRAATTTRAPTASSTRAKRSPSPDDAPVTTATLPSRRNSGRADRALRARRQSSAPDVRRRTDSEIALVMPPYRADEPLTTCWEVRHREDDHPHGAHVERDVAAPASPVRAIATRPPTLRLGLIVSVVAAIAAVAAPRHRRRAGRRHLWSVRDRIGFALSWQATGPALDDRRRPSLAV